MSEQVEPSERNTAESVRSPELERLYDGLQMGEFFAMDNADLERAAQLLIGDADGYMGFTALHYLEELDRRATNRHAKQVEAYARRLDWLTRWLVGLTVVLVILTVALI